MQEIAVICAVNANFPRRWTHTCMSLLNDTLIFRFARIAYESADDLATSIRSFNSNRSTLRH